MYNTWNERWLNTAGMRQTKIFIPNIFNRGRAKKARNLNRNDMGILIRNVTGHAFLRRHNYIVNATIEEADDEINENFLSHINNTQSQPVLNPLDEADLSLQENARICRKCRDPTSLETPYHLFTECPAVWKDRRDHLGTYDMYEAHPTWKPQPFVDFFKSLNLEN